VVIFLIDVADDVVINDCVLSWPVVPGFFLWIVWPVFKAF